uniref:J domain-containing protein n=1 Tax=Kwoniella dejecticola CBS 10117 TaxID=1296121 RepID=A0A1A6A7D7_9TREE|nr:uncharacterized protein I303_03687 [Kwoniella dejecticola CBS 10117]OBR85972.1 hypothetical protein I303_03687 [Kwoniella dejecticola CBS 10117]
MTKAIRLDQPTYYQVLGIEEDAEPDEATEAFQGIQAAAQDPPFILASTCTSDTYSSFPAPA